MVARLPGAPSFAARGMLGQAGTRWALNHGRLWGRADSPPERKGWSRLRPSLHAPLQNHKTRLLPASPFYFHLSTYHHVNDLVCVFPYLIAFCSPPL